MNQTRLSARLSTQELEMHTRELESQIKRLEHRPRPTPSERVLATQLKRERLVAKDLLDERRRV